MSNDSTVKFVEDKGKWMWKRYDANGSVISRSALFDSERAAKEDYEITGGGQIGQTETSDPAARGAVDEGQQPAEASAPVDAAPENKPEETAPVEPQPEVGAAQSEENTAGTANADAAPANEGSVNL